MVYVWVARISKRSWLRGRVVSWVGEFAWRPAAGGGGGDSGGDAGPGGGGGIEPMQLSEALPKGTSESILMTQ
jgi:hypothetical protein